MLIEDAKQLGIEAAIANCLNVIQSRHDLNAVLAVKTDAKAGTAGSLNVPFLAKDNMVTTDLPTTAGSKMLENFLSPFDATVLTRLYQAGCVNLGKTNMDEFAMGSSTENSAFGATQNPLDATRVPGGSSGGSAAAVAAGLVPFALGSDTGGSIRQPAAFCGIVGLMPTYGRVSRYGLIAMASSLDRIGPFTNTVRDAAEVLGVIAGRDPLDATTVDLPVPDFVAGLTGEIKDVRLGVPAEYFGEGIDPEVAEQVQAAVKTLESLGAEIVPISLPYSKYALATYYIIQPAEVSANLSRFDGVRFGLHSDSGKDLVGDYLAARTEGFGAEVKRRIMLGAYTLSSGFRDAYYDKAQRVRTLLKQDFDSAFEKVDAIVTPTTPTVAFRVGENIKDPLAMYKADLLTTPASMAGLPAISIPCGLVGSLPVGLQIMGKQFDEQTVLRVADAFERATLSAPWRKQLNKTQT